MQVSDAENTTETKSYVAFLPLSTYHTPRQQINNNMFLIEQVIEHSIDFPEGFSLPENCDQESKLVGFLCT